MYQGAQTGWSLPIKTFLGDSCRGSLGYMGPKVLVTMISWVLNAQLHVEQVISSEERGFELLQS